MNSVQCYELFGGIALKIHTFSFSFFHFHLLHAHDMPVFVTGETVHHIISTHVKSLTPTVVDLLINSK